ERAQLDATLRLIAAGGPFPYRQDGTVFGNREDLLPSQPRGYYHEYTVPTPGASNRGARRVIRGNNGELYYTNDHYRTFIRLDE
ncbi:MAG: ribonuclease, partial [Acidobacteriota bacterium]|nr:ribonuclease [Acidobacteriota bacterium]